MKKIMTITLALALFLLLPVQALAEWAFIAEAHHSRDGVHFEQHTFRGGCCVKCGYERNSMGTSFRDSILDNSCWVMYDSPIYDSPAGWRCVGRAETVTNYHVGDYTVRDGVVWVLLKTRADAYAPMIGWIQADKLKIDGASHVVTGDVIGCTIEITASSGRGRTGPGTEFRYVETVHFRERYVIQDMATGTNGNTWYCIRVDNQPVWISSGLTKLVSR